MSRLILILVALQAMGSLGRVADNSKNISPLQAVADHGLEFSKDFYQATAKTTPGNVIVSPVSVSSVLSMLAYGAGGSTKTALKTALHFDNNDNVQKNGLKALVSELDIKKSDVIDEQLEDIFGSGDKPLSGVELKVANRIFVANNVNVKPSYEQLTKEIFKSTVAKVDFSKTAKATKTINDWCEEQTNSKIKNAIAPGSLTADTQALLVNAVYFSGKWEYSFDAGNTENSYFQLADGTKKKVPMMESAGDRNYGELENFKATFAEFPYQGKEVSMFIILPNDVTGLKNIQKNFAKVNLNHLLTKGKRVFLAHALPKFTIENTIDLKQPLTDLGLGGIFDNSADFSAMFDVPVKIDKAVQKTYIKVDEIGTEAAGSTVVESGTLIGVDEIHRFRVNRPFYYAIIKRVGGPNGSGIVLFEGHVTDPK